VASNRTIYKKKINAYHVNPLNPDNPELLMDVEDVGCNKSKKSIWS